jgi:hypothetical protein
MAEARSRRGGEESLGERRSGGGSMLDRRYEGPEILGRLLARAGSTLDAAAAIRALASAQAEGREPPQVFPGLFPREPRFGGPEDALRTYGNLFGAWDLLEVGTDPAELLAPTPPPPPEPEEGEPAPRIELPPRGSVAGPQIPAEVVDAVWQHLDDLPARERTRRQDRYANVQSDLSEWSRRVPALSGVAEETLAHLCFELHEMFDVAFGDRLGGVAYRALEQGDPQAAAALQPHVLAYVTESLEEAEDEHEGLPAAERGEVERRAAQASAAHTAAVRPA